MKRVFFVAALLCLLQLVAQAQFNSGSTGADGALDLSGCQPHQISGACEVQLPESGILNYTTVNIPNGKRLQFIRNSRNTPVIILAQGNVNIAGAIEVNAGRYRLYPNGWYFDFFTSGPGGFDAGDYGRSGFGPGGGLISGDSNGKWIGPLSLTPIIGGSGGADKGGGGGGAVVIASSTSINVSGSVSASGVGANGFYSKSGSGGAIRLVSHSITVAGSGSLGASTNSGIPSLNGVIRVEATQINFQGSATPAATLSPINPTIVSSSQPQLTIISVGGYTVPTYAGSRFDTVDLLLPNQLPDPINVVVQAINIPSGTQIQVGFANGSGNATSSPCILTGGSSTLSCTATISNLNRTGVTYLLATATFTPSQSLAQFNLKGENQVARVRLESILGAKPKYVFLRSDNSVIDSSKLRKEFLQQFGM